MAHRALGKINPPQRYARAIACESPLIDATVHEFMKKNGDNDFCRVRGVCGHDSGEHHLLCRFSIVDYISCESPARDFGRSQEMLISICGVFVVRAGKSPVKGNRRFSV